MFHHPRTVQPAEHITIATHSAIPMETADRTETTIEKVCACVCIVSIQYWVIKERGLCVCVFVRAWVYLLSLRLRTRSLVICPISSGRNSSLLDRSDMTVTFLQLPIWNTQTHTQSDYITYTSHSEQDPQQHNERILHWTSSGWWVLN